MAVTLYNYRTLKKESFRPLQQGSVGLYTCGPTVYNHQHIGNYRTYIFEDVLRRALEWNGYRVRHVMNITDVGHLTGDVDAGEDKLELGAKREKKTVWEVARFYTRSFLRDLPLLNIKRADVVAPATAHIADQIRVIRRLVARGYAYETPTAVYFDVRKFKPYGKYSHQPLAKLKIGARAEVIQDPAKRHPADFALWFKRTGKFKHHAMHWPSPWGDGFPGWHIECSAISSKHLGQPFDIHTGAVDHIFPHHTNEIAQSEAAYGKPLARFWLEGAHLVVDGRKMSKSLGNVYLIRDVINRGFDPLDFRYFVLGAHYRTQLNFTWKALAAAARGRAGLSNAIERIRRGPSAGRRSGSLRDEVEVLKVVAAAERQFRAALTDDLNTPKALAVVNELLHYGNSLLDRRLPTGRAVRIIGMTVKTFDRVLGLGLGRRQKSAIPNAVRKLAAEREAFRRAKRWAEADKLRERIKKLGYLAEDTVDGLRLKISR